MTDATHSEGQEAPKSSKGPLILGLLLALLGGAGGFYATHQGLVLSSESAPEDVQPAETTEKFNEIAFVPLEPLMISMPRSSQYKHLRFRGELEVVQKHKAEVELVAPRIIDVLNGYLRAVELADIEAPESLVRLRSQMLRRVQIVSGPGRVNDLLIMEFVLN